MSYQDYKKHNMKIPTRLATVAVILAASLSLSACGGGGGGSDNPLSGANNNGNSSNPGTTAGTAAGGTGSAGTGSGSGQSAGAGSSSTTTTTDSTTSGLTTAQIMGLQSAIQQSSTNAPSTVDSREAQGQADTGADTNTQSDSDSGTDTNTDSGTSVPSLSLSPGTVPSAPTGVSISIDHLLGPTVIDLQSGATSVAWSDPVSIGTGRYDGFKMTRPGGKIRTSGNPPIHTTDGIPETAWVWTDIQDPDYVDFEVVYPPWITTPTVTIHMIP